MKVLIVGGLGYLGSQIHDAVRALPKLSASIATRAPFARGQIKLDLRDPETFPVMADFDAVVNASDSLSAPPDDAIRWCLDNGVTFIETSSDPETVERLADGFRGQNESGGTLVLGAGIFTGMSNLIGARAVGALPGEPDILDLGISFSPLSKGGQGMVNLVNHYLNIDTVYYRDGQRRTSTHFTDGPTFTYPSGERGSVRMPFAEATMLQQSTGAPNVTTYMTPKPGLMRLSFLYTPLVLLRNPIAGALLWVVFTLLRRVLLSWRTSSVELSAIATDDEQNKAECNFSVKDGMKAAGYVVASLLDELQNSPPPPGGYLIDEIVDADRIVFKLSDFPQLEMKYTPPGAVGA